MPSEKRFAVCVDNRDYPASLELRKVYQVLPDQAAAARSYLRVIDESGQDYLYPRRMFLRVSVRPEARATLIKVLSFRRRKNSKASLKSAKRPKTQTS